jgi:UPF0755 protein
MPIENENENAASERPVTPRRSIALTLAASTMLALLACGGFAYFYLWRSPPPKFAERAMVPMVTIERGASTRQVARQLKRAGVIRSAMLFSLYGSYSGAARRIKPGDYAFAGGERIPEVMNHLVRGDIVTVNVTIPEGLTLHEIALRVGETGLVCPDDFERHARAGRLVRSLGLMPLGAEGFLFPATYRFSPRASVDEVIAAMLARFYTVLAPSVEERMFALGLDARRLVTLASIVEREAKSPAERPLIAAVFYNRLRAGIPLQSDPTAEYALEGIDVSAASAVRTPSAFNTYIIAGLPPGPIANPGMKSIEAALYPSHTDFLYFVARDDGTHQFSRNFADHRRAIARGRAIAARSPAEYGAKSRGESRR